MIITSVVPPELPMELSLAVNSSLIALHKLGIFCTEPFRIPFAGKLDICCFDKTGTLTTDNLLLKGIAGLKYLFINFIKFFMLYSLLDITELLEPNSFPDEIKYILSGCHSLVHIDDQILGDPMEIASLKAIQWNFSKG